MVVLGVTGGVGTGKSTVAKMFKELGAVILDADVLAHEAMEPKRLAWRQIIKLFGERVVNDDQTIDRNAVARIVFADEAKRRQLEEIVHPHVLRRIKQRLRRWRRAPRTRRVRAVVLDVPLLLETGAQDLADAVVVVTAPAQQQRERLARKYGWSEEEMERRQQAQWKLSAKEALADYVVDNANGLERTRTQVRQIWKQAVRGSR